MGLLMTKSMDIYAIAKLGVNVRADGRGYKRTYQRKDWLDVRHDKNESIRGWYATFD